jgi:hypothetical protein
MHDSIHSIVYLRLATQLQAHDKWPLQTILESWQNAADVATMLVLVLL